MHFLPMGFCSLDQYALNKNLTKGTLIKLPVWSFLLETQNNELILIDSGMPDCFINKPDFYKGTRREGLLVPHMSKENTIEMALKRVGYLPEDINSVICTHMHLDHAGGNGYFKNAKIYVQEEEYNAAMGNDDYSPIECRLENLNYHVIKGDYDLVDGVKLISTAGHTPGQQSVLVKTETTGYILLTIDVAYTQEIFDNEIEFLCNDPKEALNSTRKLKKLISEVNPKIVFFGHDVEQGKTIKTYPTFY